jgi:hypothetical protein
MHANSRHESGWLSEEGMKARQRTTLYYCSTRVISVSAAVLLVRFKVKFWQN